MEVEFETKKLYRLFTEETTSNKIPAHIVIKYRNVVNLMREARSLSELSQRQSLNIEKIGKGLWSARLNKQFRLIFNFVKPNTVIIKKISKHYEDL